jgi:hypothetical protein
MGVILHRFPLEKARTRLLHAVVAQDPTTQECYVVTTNDHEPGQPDLGGGGERRENALRA